MFSKAAVTVLVAPVGLFCLQVVSGFAINSRLPHRQSSLLLYVTIITYSRNLPNSLSRWRSHQRIKWSLGIILRMRTLVRNEIHLCWSHLYNHILAYFVDLLISSYGSNKCCALTGVGNQLQCDYLQNRKFLCGTCHPIIPDCRFSQKCSRFHMKREFLIGTGAEIQIYVFCISDNVEQVTVLCNCRS